MKKMNWLVWLFLFGQINGYGQNAVPVTKDTVVKSKKEPLPYIKYPKLPAFNIMLTDTTTIFNTFNIPAGTVVALMLFDPGCRHCADLTRTLVAKMDSLKDIQFYMVSATHNMEALRQFIEDFKLSEFPNIKVIGRDYEFFFHDFYGVKFIPDIVLYDKNKDLIKLYEGETTVKELYDATH